MRPVYRSRLAVAVCAVPALLLGLAACGGADATQEPARTVARTSPQGDWDEKTLVPAMVAAIEDQDSAHLSARATGEPDRSIAAEGDLVLRGKQHDMALTVKGGPLGAGTAEVRAVGSVLYVSVPGMTPEGKFLEIRRGDEASPFGGMMGAPHEADPQKMMAAFETALEKVRYVGEESVQGQELGHYRLTLDPREVAKSHEMPSGAGMSGLAGTPRTGKLPREVTVDVWLDEDALVHRVELDLPRRGSLAVELSEWGEPVTVEAPPQKDILSGPSW